MKHELKKTLFTMEQHLIEATAQAEDAKMKGDALLAAVVSGGQVALSEQSQQIKELVDSNSNASEKFHAAIEATNAMWQEMLQQEIDKSAHQELLLNSEVKKLQNEAVFGCCSSCLRGTDP